MTLGRYGIGRRTAMSNANSSSSWTYDARGRMTQESKAINGYGTFVTQWAYNSADLTTSMQYPANNTGGLGEQVTTEYYPQMKIKDVFSNTFNGYYYVPFTTYPLTRAGDAAGRVVWRSLGAPNLPTNPVLVDAYGYNA